MDIVLVILAIFCAIIGIVGAIVPGLPGPPFAWLAVLLQSFTKFDEDFTPTFLIITAVLAVVITVLDYVVPAWGTKRFGGTPAGTKGSTIGLLVSVFLLPFLGITIGPFGIVGILLGPFAGAYIGERINSVDDKLALRSAFGSFMGFMAGTFIKLVFGIVMTVFLVKNLL